VMADADWDDWLNEGDLIEILEKEHGLTEAWARDILKTVLGSIGGALAEEKAVMIRNFGKFEMRESHGKVRPKFDASKNLLEEYGRDELVSERID